MHQAPAGDAQGDPEQLGAVVLFEPSDPVDPGTESGFVAVADLCQDGRWRLIRNIFPFSRRRFSG
jgi:hypothetical protein